MEIRADIVTVFHNDHNYELSRQLRAELEKHEPSGYTFIGVDNRRNNRGFAAGCNLGAFTAGATAPIIGFLNPDVEVFGPFLDQVQNTLIPPVVITGCRFGKSQAELQSWGVADWVCGAVMFVNRAWFAAVKGFDLQFIWTWEETDLIRQAQAQGMRCQSIELPIMHESPAYNSEEDAAYKRHHFSVGAQRFQAKWPRAGRRPARRQA